MTMKITIGYFYYDSKSSLTASSDMVIFYLLEVMYLIADDINTNLFSVCN